MNSPAAILESIPWGDDVPFEVTNVIGWDEQRVTDLTGWSATLTFKSSREQADPGLLQKTSVNGDITFSGGTARALLTRTEAVTLFVPDEFYYFKFQLKSPDDRMGTIRSGRIMFRRDGAFSV